MNVGRSLKRPAKKRFRLFSECWPTADVPDLKPVLGDKLRFFLMHMQYDFDPKYGTVIQIYGNEDKTSVPVHIQLYGYLPHFYFRVPEAWGTDEVEDFIDTLNDAFVNHLGKILGIRRRSKLFSKDLWDLVNNDTQKYVMGWKYVEAQELVEYRGEDSVRFVDVQMLNPKLVKFAREFIENPSGRDSHEKGGFVPRDWCQDRGMRKDVGKLLLFEADVDFTIRFLVDQRYAPCSWFDIDLSKFAWKNTMPESRRLSSAGRWRPEHDFGVEPRIDLIGGAKNRRFLSKKRESSCLFEGMVHYSEMKLVKGEEEYVGKIPNFKELAFDGEMENDGGDEFPNPKKHKLLQMSNYLWRENDHSTYTSYLFALKGTDLPKDCDHVFWFDYEIDLVKAWFQFIHETDPDVMVGHNSSGFDIVFFIERAKVLGIKGLSRFGRSLHRNAYVQQSVNKGFTKSNAIIPGRLALDTMRLEQEVPGALVCTLAACALKYLKNETKGEVLYDQITRCQKTRRGRKRLAKYCLKDSKIVMLLVQKLNAVRAALAGSQLASVPPQTCLNRSQGIKMEGGLRAECNPADGIAKLKIVRSTAMRRDKKRERVDIDPEYTGDKGYKGATVLEPDRGYYRGQTITLDFASLYPSIMMARNLCFSTLVHNETIGRLGLVEGKHYWRSPDYRVSKGANGKEYVEEVVNLDNPAFLLASFKKGILPQMQEKLLAQRKALRKEAGELLEEIEAIKLHQRRSIIAKATGEPAIDDSVEESGEEKTEWSDYIKTNPAAEKAYEKILDQDPELKYKEKTTKHLVLDIRQLSIKIWMNSLYGLTGFFESPFYCPEISSVITREGRGMILKMKIMVEQKYTKANGYPFNAKVIYGDTDSIFVYMGRNMTVEQAFEWGKKIAAEVTSIFPPPIRLTFEKTYTVLGMINKKNYYGCKWVIEMSEPMLDVKGCDFKKGKTPAYIKKTCMDAVRVVTMGEEHTIFDDAVSTLGTAMDGIIERKVPVSSLIETQKMSKKLSEYGLPKQNKKTGKLSKGSYPPGVAMLKRRWERSARIAKAKNSTPPKEPEPGRVARYVMTEPTNGKMKKNMTKGERAEDPLDVVKKKIPVDFDNYRESLEKKVMTYFGHALNVLSSENKKRKAGCLDDDCDDSLVPQDPKRIKSAVTAALYGGPQRNAKPPPPVEGRGLMKFFAAVSGCPFCKAKNEKGRQTKTCERCYDKLLPSVSVETKKMLDLEKDKKALWDKCMACIDGDLDEAKTCRSATCQTFGARDMNSFDLEKQGKKLRDIRDDVSCVRQIIKAKDLLDIGDIEDLIAPKDVELIKSGVGALRRSKNKRKSVPVPNKAKKSTKRRKKCE